MNVMQFPGMRIPEVHINKCCTDVLLGEQCIDNDNGCGYS